MRWDLQSEEEKKMKPLIYPPSPHPYSEERGRKYLLTEKTDASKFVFVTPIIVNLYLLQMIEIKVLLPNLHCVSELCQNSRVF